MTVERVPDIGSMGGDDDGGGGNAAANSDANYDRGLL